MRGNLETRSESRLAVVTAVLIAAAISVVAVPPAQADPPEGRTYFTIVLGLESPASYQASCLTFTRTGVCTSGGHCGSWTAIGAPGQTPAISLKMSFDYKGIAVRIDGRGRVDSRSDRRHSLAGTARARIADHVVNFGFAGRPESAGQCARSLRKWEEKNDVLRY